MKKHLSTTVAMAFVMFLTSPAGAQANPDGRFSGPAIFTDFWAADKPVKSKTQISLDFNSSSLASTFQEGNDPILSSGSAFVVERYLYVKYQTGAAVLAGRLLMKGKPGAETGLTGTLISTFNGYAGSYEYKVNLKKQ